MLPLLAVAVGQTFVLVTGGIDLSVTSIIALSSVAGGAIMSAETGILGQSAWAVPAGLACMLWVGIFLGSLNGAAVTGLKMPPFIVTLTAMMFFGGLAVWSTQSRNIYGLPEALHQIGKGAWISVPVGTGSRLQVSNPLLVVAALGVAAHVILSRSLLGRWLVAVGMNSRAAAIAGVPVGGTVFFAYAFSGFCAAVASVLYTGRLETASPVLGQRIFLDVIAAVVIGGTSLFGGKGSVLWTVYGVLFITLVDNSLNVMGASNFTILMAKGGVILFAAILDALRRRLQGGR
jgi:ribose/xylose/arabinose/galactoside ABC-type transport system permease subunit